VTAYADPVADAEVKRLLYIVEQLTGEARQLEGIAAAARRESRGWERIAGEAQRAAAKVLEERDMLRAALERVAPLSTKGLPR
jgi:hypothetical protein